MIFLRHVAAGYLTNHLSRRGFLRVALGGDYDMRGFYVFPALRSAHLFTVEFSSTRRKLQQIRSFSQINPRRNVTSLIRSKKTCKIFRGLNFGLCGA